MRNAEHFRTLAVWTGSHNLGGILTGSSTDVGTGPVWVPLAMSFWPAARTHVPVGGKPAIARPARGLPGDRDRHHGPFRVKEILNFRTGSGGFYSGSSYPLIRWTRSSARSARRTWECI
jgi:hypothetical protein